MKTRKLPNKMSELILLALRDLKKIEKLKSYEVDMREWHTAPEDTYGESTKCQVCFAGSVISRTLKMPKNKTVDMSMFSNKMSNKFYALDSLRQGYVGSAYRALGIDSDAMHGMDRRITPYSYDSKKFKEEMYQLAQDLKKEGF